MKFTLSWLSDHLDITVSTEKICHMLPDLGFVVAQVTDKGKDLENFRVAQIVETHPHPQADRLQICTVNTGKKSLQVVCGAPNARPGLKTVLALPGDVIPATQTILKAGKIRGIDSEGMLCSAEELNLETCETSAGIMEIPDEASVGAPLLEWISGIETLIEIEVTPNRGDMFSIRGIARELAAAGAGTLKPLPTSKPFLTSSASGIFIGAPEACPFFVSCKMQNVTNTPSPLWLQNKLKSVGLRPISALVDITNYLMHDLGRPLHVFDADRLKGPLSLRLSEGSETFQALNGETYVLPEQALVIEDDNQIVSLAGIMGGIETGCLETTTNVLIESAYFSPEVISQAGQALNLHSDSRTRFERGVDPAMVLPGLEQAINLISQICGGRPGPIEITGAPPPANPEIAIESEKFKTTAGTNIPDQEILRILDHLGFAPALKNGVIRTCPPSWRSDIDTPAALLEEVTRVYGYAKIPSVPLPLRPQHSPLIPGLSIEQQRPFKIKRCLSSRGLYEMITWAFTSAHAGKKIGAYNPDLMLCNPISAELALMRPHILPHLLDSARQHMHRSLTFQSVFEVGPIYTTPQSEGQQEIVVGLIPFYPPAGWKKIPSADVFEAKNHVLAALETCGIQTEKLQCLAQGPQWYHPGRKGAFQQGPRVLAYFGEIHPQVLKDFGVDIPCAGFEIFLQQLPLPKPCFPRQPLTLSPFQPVTRDLAFLLENDIPAETLLNTLKKAAGKEMISISVFDFFDNEQYLGKGKKSLAVRFVLQSAEKTLDDSFIEPIIHRMIEEAAKKTGATLRTGIKG